MMMLNVCFFYIRKLKQLKRTAHLLFWISRKDKRSESWRQPALLYPTWNEQVVSVTGATASWGGLAGMKRRHRELAGVPLQAKSVPKLRQPRAEAAEVSPSARFTTGRAEPAEIKMERREEETLQRSRGNNRKGTEKCP